LAKWPVNIRNIIDIVNVRNIILNIRELTTYVLVSYSCVDLAITSLFRPR